MIALQNVVKEFKDTPVLEDITFSIEKGESCGLVGLNGAGKTTLLRIILGLLKPSSGTLAVNGIDPQKGAGTFYRSLGVVLESDGFNGNLSFAENLSFWAECARIKKTFLKEYLVTEWPELFQRREPVKLFSRGQRMQCALARAFMGTPDLLILDEPTATLDIEGYKKFCHLVKHAQHRGATLLISSHRLDTISDLCSTALFLEEGRLQKESLVDSDSSVWVVRCEQADLFAKLVRELGGEVARTELTWLEFTGVAEESIPSLISLAVHRECRLYELRKKNLLQKVLER